MKKEKDTRNAFSDRQLRSKREFLELAPENLKKLFQVRKYLEEQRLILIIQ
jgi:hypothetical protein